jgi:hypothetical protein
MEAAVGSALGAILGTDAGPTQNSSMYPNMQYSTMSDALGNTVPIRVKEKIWRNQYVELGDLINPKYTDSYSVAWVPSASGSKMSMFPDSKSRSIKDIYRWTSAFHVYVAIYAERYPHETPALMKYAERVRDLARLHQGTAWRFYDFRFRQLKQTHPFLSWAECHTDIWMRATLEPTDGNLGMSEKVCGPQPQTSRNQKGVCYAYNNQGTCSANTCSFIHKCQICKGDHPRKDCNQNVGENDTNDLDS